MTVMQSTMIHMLIYIALVALGNVLGGRHLWGDLVSRWLGKLQLASLLALIVALGIRLGADEEVMGSLGQIGLSSLTITLFSMTGSLIAVALLRRYILRLDRFGRHGETAAEASSGSDPEEQPRSGLTKWIVIAVAAGMAIGYFLFTGRSTVWCGTIIDVGLYLLLFLVGIDMGQQGNVLQDIRAAGFKVLLVPGTVVIGTLLFSFAGSFLLPLSIRETIAASAGFGWYYSLLISLVVYTGAFQYVLTSMMAAGTSLITIALTALFMNSRQLFYSISFVDDFNKIGKAKPYMIHSLTDETYAVFHTLDLTGSQKRQVMLYMALMCQFYWCAGAVLGGVAGSLLPFSSMT